MISVPNNTPKTVSFTQTVDNNTAEIAKAQIGKLALDETTALGAKENADFHLAKATENLRLAELAYRESITKSVWNKEELRKAYNNAIAGYRLADTNAQKAAEALTLAKSALAGTRATANGEIVKREFSSDKRDELASKGKAMPDGSFPIETRADLANAIQSYGRASDPKAVKAHIITQAKALGATDALPEDWKDASSLSTAVPTNKSIFRKELSQGPTTPMDYTIDPSMGAPMTAGQTNADVSENYDKVLCPDCLGFDGNEGCPTCAGVHFIAIMKSAPRTANPFSTDELLTLPFQKSSAYQNYIMKGGDGSGAQPGHEFNGNQWTGGMRAFPKLGIKEGWKQTIKRYEGAHDQHVAAGRQAATEAHALEQAGKLREAADKHEEANSHLMKAHGALKGMQNIMQRETDNGSHGAEQGKVAGYAGRASSIRGEANAAADNVARLAPMADAADRARA
jgi:hypothetical protein